MRGIGFRILVVVLAAGLVGAACGKKSGNPFGIGTSGLPTNLPTALPTNLPSLPSGIPTTLPSGIPTTLPSGFPTVLPSGLPSNTGTLNNGTAHLQVSGSVHGTFDLSLQGPGEFVPPPGGIALIYIGPSGDEFGIGGPSFTGTKKTASTLIVTVVITSKGFFFGTSSGGECTIHLTTAKADDVEGTMVCDKMPSPGGTVDVTATFSATS
ncbi:MAG: hypothetical protein M3Q23_10495 [Actinomycetota bacterium]|nr:hypothetical protein [Actinomycetota bacterium]